MKINILNVTTTACMTYIKWVGCKDVLGFIETKDDLEIQLQNGINYFKEHGVLKITHGIGNSLVNYVYAFGLVKEAMKECETQAGFEISNKSEVYMQKHLDLLKLIKPTLDLHLEYALIFLRIVHNIDLR